MIKIAMAGAAGRMGKIILQLAIQDKVFKIVGALEQRGHAALGQDLGPILGRDLMGVKVTQDATAATKNADVLIDFSHFSALSENLKAAVKTRTACVFMRPTVSAWRVLRAGPSWWRTRAPRRPCRRRRRR